MINIMFAPAKKEDALVARGKKYISWNMKKATAFGFGQSRFLYTIVSCLAEDTQGMLEHPVARRKAKTWYSFLHTCKKHKFMRIYHQNNKLVYEVPTYFEV